MKVKKHFYLKCFDVSLLQLRYSVLIHIQNFFDILQVCYNKVFVLCKYLGEQSNYKKHFKVNKIRINCYRYPCTDNNKADNAKCYKK